MTHISTLYSTCPETRDGKKGYYHSTFLQSALKWSAALGPVTHGSMELHNALAGVLWDMGSLKMACVHWVLGEVRR